jgi:pimeloyl-ACP methyl ester carboxylesterase
MKPQLLSVMLAAFLAACSPSAGEPETKSVDQASPDMAANIRFTYVLVHGATGGGWDWRTVDDLLTANGHYVYRPTLTGLGEKWHLSNPDIDLTTHINDVANLIRFENLSDVVLVGHSYGGMVITGVMELIPERIRHAIFLDAAVPEDGMSAEALWGDVTSNAEVRDGMIYFSWLDADAPLPRDVPQSLKTYTQPVSFSNPAALKLPATLIAFVPPGVSQEERSADPSWQHAKARNWTIRTLDSDHNAQRSHPEELVALLEEIVGNGN